MPRTKREASPGRRLGRVNQKMIDQMIRMRTEGYTHAEIARQLRISPRTSRRHTEGVAPQLVHSGEDKRVDLLSWGAAQLRVIQQRWRLSVEEFDITLKHVRTVVTGLDELTVEELERDPQLRAQFLQQEVWPPAHEKIDDLRMARDLPTTFDSARKHAI